MISADAAGQLVLGSKIFYRDVITNAPDSTVNAVIQDTLDIGTPSALVIDSVYTEFYEFTQGQTGLRVRMDVRNAGSSIILLNDAGLTFNRVDPVASPTTITANRISPTIFPTLLENQTTT